MGYMIEPSNISCYPQERLRKITRHINDVRNNAEILGLSLINKGEVTLGHDLIKNSYVHDASKFEGIEWLYLNQETFESNPNYFKLAQQSHWANNQHHPEYWPGGIEEMPRIYLAEMAIDCSSRGGELGTDVREWFKEEATKKYKFSTCGKIYKEIKYFLDLLFDGRL